MEIKRALSEYPNYEGVIKGILEVGSNIDKLKSICKITPGIFRILIYRCSLQSDACKTNKINIGNYEKTWRLKIHLRV